MQVSHDLFRYNKRCEVYEALLDDSYISSHWLVTLANSTGCPDAAGDSGLLCETQAANEHIRLWYVKKGPQQDIQPLLHGALDTLLYHSSTV